MFNFERSQKYLNHVSKLEKQEVEKLFTRFFKTEEGQKIMAYLQHITCNRVLNSNATDEELRYAEGERSLFSKIIRLSNSNS